MADSERSAARRTVFERRVAVIGEKLRDDSRAAEWRALDQAALAALSPGLARELGVAPDVVRAALEAEGFAEAFEVDDSPDPLRQALRDSAVDHDDPYVRAGLTLLAAITSGRLAPGAPLHAAALARELEFPVAKAGSLRQALLAAGLAQKVKSAIVVAEAPPEVSAESFAETLAISRRSTTTRAKAGARATRDTAIGGQTAAARPRVSGSKIELGELAAAYLRASEPSSETATPMFDTVRPGVAFAKALQEFPAGKAFSVVDTAEVIGLSGKKARVVLAALAEAKIVEGVTGVGFRIREDRPPIPKDLPERLKAAQIAYEGKRAQEGKRTGKAKK